MSSLSPSVFVSEDKAMRRRWLIVGIVVLACALAITGGYVAVRAFIGSPDAVHIVVTQVQPPPTPPGTHPLAGSLKITTVFDQRFSRQASPIYQQMVSGFHGTTGGGSCPISANGQSYYHYVLTFFHLGIHVATATSDGIGCEDIIVVYPGGSSTTFSWVSVDHASFGVRLHQLTSAPEPTYSCVTPPSCGS